MKIVVISAAMLKAADACQPQVDLFIQTFGERLVFDKRSALIHVAKRHAEDFDFAWALGGLVRTERARWIKRLFLNKKWREVNRIDFICNWTFGLLGYNWRYAEFEKVNKRFHRRCAVAFAKLLWEEA